VRDWGKRLGADLPRLLGQFQELFHQEEGEAEGVLVLNREFLSDNVIRLLRDAIPEPLKISATKSRVWTCSSAC